MPIFAHWIVCEEGIIKFAKMDEENITYAHVWIEAIGAVGCGKACCFAAPRSHSLVRTFAA